MKSNCILLVRWAALLALLLLIPQPAFATDEMRKAVAELAEKLQRFLQGKEQKQIVVAEFTEKGSLGAPNSGMIKLLLTEELKKKGVEAAIAAEYKIKGEFALSSSDPDDAALLKEGVKLVAVELTAQLVNRQGKEVELEVKQKQFSRIVKGQSTAIALYGPTVALPAPKTGDEKYGTIVKNDQSLRDAIEKLGDKKPKPEIKNSVVRSKRTGEDANPYAVEILVGGKFEGEPARLNGAKPREAKLEAGMPFVPLQRDEEFAIRIINESKNEVAVQVRLDGINMFAFSQLLNPDTIEVKNKETSKYEKKPHPRAGQPRYTMLIIPAKSGVTIPGWHVNNEQSDRFQITSYAQSAVKVLAKSQTAELGMITAEFQEIAATARSIEPGDLVGRGERVNQKYQEKSVVLGQIVDTISLRYKTPQKK